MRTDELLDRDALDGMLHALPSHILFFDDALICRYAAPSGSHFLGIGAEEAPGLPLDRVIPPLLSMRPYLESVLHSQQPVRIPHLHYPGDPNGRWDAGTWDIYIQPYSLRSHGPDEAGATPGDTMPGVLMTCIESICVYENLPGHTPGSPSAGQEADVALTPVGQAHVANRSAAFVERVRTKLTVIRGFAQLMRQREQRAHPEADLSELNRISEATNELTDLLQRYEQSERSAAHRRRNG